MRTKSTSTGRSLGVPALVVVTTVVLIASVLSAAPTGASDLVVLDGPPDPPTDVTVEPGDGQVTVGWTAPSGGADSYTVTAAPGDRQCVTTTTTCVVDGLLNGVGHTFTVVATRDGFASAPSAPSAIVYPGSTPLTAPTEVVATAGDGEARVRWTWNDFGEEPVDEFAVTAQPGGATCVVQAFSCVVTGLTNGEAYTFTAVARLDGVNGLASAPSNPVTPGPAPGALGPLSVTDDGQVTWSFGPGGGIDELTLRYREAPAPADWLEPLIIGGDPLAIDNHRYGVKLFAFDGATIVSQCGGTLIDPWWVLTAAHCTEYQPTGSWYTSIDYMTVIPGVADWTDFDTDLDRHRIFSDAIFVHPDYESDNLANDLALVRLERPVAADVAEPIPLYPFGALRDGAPAFVSGWGLDDNGISPDVLRGVDVTVDADCGGWPATGPAFDALRTMCTSTAPVGTCSGDSGGPVVVNEGGTLFLAGVVSFGAAVGCGVNPMLPDAHVRVSAYLDWIQDRTGELWVEAPLAVSSTSFSIGGLQAGRTYVVTVEAANAIASAHAVATVTIPGGEVQGPGPALVDCTGSIPHPFSDVAVTSFAYDSVGCIFELGITTGTSPTTYSPGQFVTREQMAAFVARFISLIQDRSCRSAPPFFDVAVTSFAYDSVGCIHELGITTGTSPTTYSPGEFVTREQMAAFVARVYRLLTGQPCSSPAAFLDVVATSFAHLDIGCIADLGITTGTSATTYAPTEFVTREQMAAFLERLFNAVSA